MKKILILFILVVTFGAVAFAQVDLQTAAIVRLTRSEPITVGQLRTEVRNAESQAGRPLSNTERRQVLDLMINEKLVLQAAERDRITVTDNEINQQIQTLKSQMAQQIGRQPTEDEFAEAIRNETGFAQPAFREQLRRSLIVQKYLMAKKGSLIENIQMPNEQDIRNFYNLSRTQFVRPDTVRFSMINIPYGVDIASKNRARETADRLNREIGSVPARFDEAYLRGQSSGAGYQAVEGYLPRNLEAQQATGANFINAAFALQQGQISGVIEGLEAYHIVKITETYSQKSLELDDIIQPGSRVTVRDYIGNYLLQERQQAALVTASNELTTELRAGNSYQVFDNALSSW